MEPLKTIYTSERTKWREWLAENFEKEEEIWFVFPMKESGEKGLSYNDTVEEALCFGWIDSTIKNMDSLHRAQRFSPRRKGSGYSRANIERLIWLESQGMIHPNVRESVLEVIKVPYEFPEDILEAIRSEKKAWDNYQKFPEEYKRIRIAYIDAARKRPLEFKKRLENFISKTKENKLIGYGGIDKYFKKRVE
ncbi:YdeI/OmpD-associated family protein [Anaerobium acetethylicum]|nr:YdeI/OmpD-associated family protein [Anaerobium acetethylicum]